MPNEQHKRLIDHFKRALGTIFGLAITTACINLFSDKVLDANGAVLDSFGHLQWSDLRLMLFAIFLVTIVPIYQGGDRSLDVRHMEQLTGRGWRRLSFVVDVFFLLITAVLFVKVAVSIPRMTPVSGGSFHTFLHSLQDLMIFDCIVLSVDYLKSWTLEGSLPHKLRVYGYLIPINLFFGIVCMTAASVSKAYGHDGIICATVLSIAILRTFIDYVLDYKNEDDFMFPAE